MQSPGTPAAVPVLLVLCALAAGCSSATVDNFLGETPVTPSARLAVTAAVTTPAALPATPAAATVAATPATPSPAPVPVVTTPGPAPVTEPVQELPPERQVSLVLTKDRPTSGIHLLYQGGPGEIYVTRVTMWVYSGPTAYTEYIMSGGKKPIPGDEIVAPGTRSGDRCEVFVISSGTRYRVIDEPVYGGMYY